MGGGVVSGDAGNWVGVVLAVVVSSTVTVGEVSWVGGGVTGAFGLQPSSIVIIKITGTKLPHFIFSPQALVGDLYRHGQPVNPIIG